MKIFLCFLLLLPATFMFAQNNQKKTIKASEAKNYVGKTVTVLDKIHEARLDHISKKEVNVLYTGADYNHRTLALIFPQDVLKRFSYNPNSKMINNTFYATGKIVMYKGKPAMYIRNEDQLNVAE